MTDIAYHLEHPDPRALAVLAFVFESLGIRAERLEPPTLWNRPHLVYGGTTEPLSNGIKVEEHAGHVLWPELLEGAVDPATLGGRVNFDLIAAIGAFLGDEIHREVEPDGLDQHGRLTYPASFSARSGYGDRPIVNDYVAFLGRLIGDRLRVVGSPRWPDGRLAAIGLSHDVDHPARYAIFGSVARPWRLRRSPRTYALYALRLGAARVRDRNPNDFWLFDQLMASESRLGFRSTFFFATVPFHARLGAHDDVQYDIGGRRFRRALGSLREEGFEIGLHASYRAYEDPARFSAERDRLASLAGCDIAGIRHHYWQLGPDIAATLRAHEQAGFAYDSSLAFNDHIGFRRSVALPFHAFDPVLERPLRVAELPTFCMDGNLFYTSSDVDAAAEAVARALLKGLDWGIIGDPDPVHVADAVEQLMAAPTTTRPADPAGQYDLAVLAGLPADALTAAAVDTRASQGPGS